MRSYPVSPMPRTLALGLLFATLTALAACNLQLSTDVEAKDEWTRTYSLTADGALSIKNGNGRIEVVGGDGPALTITAERIVKASTEEAAKEQLALLEMNESVTSDRVSLDSSTRGLTVNVSRRVNYKVTMPRGASLTLVGSNGDIVVTGVTGPFSAEASNGRITATGLEGSAKVSTINGVISLEFDRVAEGGITAETTNGTIVVSIPKTSNADLSARVTNGAISNEGLDVQVSEQSRRRLDGKIGAGGPSIRLETTNGAITVKGHS